MKKILLKMSLGLALFGGLALPVQAATSNGQTTGQVSFYAGATTRMERQSLVIDQKIPNGETAYQSQLANGQTKTSAAARIPGWFKTTTTNARLPQTDEARTTYWLILGTMLLLVAGLLKLIQQTKNGEATGHVER